MTHSLSFRILGQCVRIEHDAPHLDDLLIANFGAMTNPAKGLPADLRYVISETDSGLFIHSPDRVPLRCGTPDDLLFLLDKCITVDLQKQRPDLLFLHSAAVERQGKAYLFAADSGCGKSTTTWAMLHHGFGYLSDELSPIDMESMQILPYPHALCLKRPPPLPYPLPDTTIALKRTMHVPTESLPAPTITEPMPLGGVFLVRYCPDLEAPSLRVIGPAEAGARLYVTALNALAHHDYGLDSVVSIVAHVPCYALSTADLAKTCDLIRNAVD